MRKIIAITALLLVTGCKVADTISPPLEAAEAQTVEFIYTHTGCPVDLLVWSWVEGVAEPPRTFLNLAESLRLSLPGERVTWRLRVDNAEPLGFTVDGEGDCTLTQPGCF